MSSESAIGSELTRNSSKRRTDTHVWAQTYNRDVADLFAVQSEIAQAIAGQLHAKISLAEKLSIERAPTADLNAFDLYAPPKLFLRPRSLAMLGKRIYSKRSIC